MGGFDDGYCLPGWAGAFTAGDAHGFPRQQALHRSFLAAWLIWVGVGSQLGAWVVVKVQKPLVLLLKSAAALLVILPATILLIRFLRAFYDLPPGAHLSLNDIALSSFLVMAPVCLLLGASIFTFHHKSLIGINTTAPITNKINNARHKGGFGKIHPVFWVLLVLAGIIFPFLENVDDWAYRLQWQHFTPEHELFEMHHSEHGAISVVQRHDQYSFFQSGHLVFSSAGPETIAPGLEEQEAVEFAHMAMVQHQKPQKVLLIGGGLRVVSW